MADFDIKGKAAEWCQGNVAAAETLELFYYLTFVIDDFVDGDVKPADRSQKMCRMMEIALVRLPNNPFYSQHQATFHPIVLQILLLYHQSNEYKEHDIFSVKMHSYAWKDLYRMLFYHVGYLIGGWDYAQWVAEDYETEWIRCHSQDETVEARHGNLG